MGIFTSRKARKAAEASRIAAMYRLEEARYWAGTAHEQAGDRALLSAEDARLVGPVR